VPREIREAGRKLGSRFVKTVKNMDLPYETDIFRRYCESRQKMTVTHSVVYGVFCAAIGMPYEDVMEHYLYAQTSSMVTNCVKSIPLSQTDGQLLLCRCHGLFEELLERVGQLTEEDLCLSAPGFDIRCMQHEGLYSRIYMS
jgi:urease accessory protein